MVFQERGDASVLGRGYSSATKHGFNLGCFQFQVLRKQLVDPCLNHWGCRTQNRPSVNAVTLKTRTLEGSRMTDFQPDRRAAASTGGEPGRSSSGIKILKGV